MPLNKYEIHKQLRSRKRVELVCDESALERLAQELSEEAAPGDLFFLEGDLGSGKTAFSRFFLEARGLQFNGSPTFPVVQVYPGVSHMDLYRLEDFSELSDTGILEILSSRSTVSLVEWSNKFPEIKENLSPAHQSVEIRFSFSENQPENRKLKLRLLDSN